MADRKRNVYGMFVLPQIHRACLLPLNSNLEKYFKIHLTFDFSEAYLEPSKRSKMELFAKIVNGFRSIPVSAKSSIFDVWLGSLNTPLNI